MRKPLLTEQEFEALLDTLRKGTIETAKADKWRPSELAMTLSDLPRRITKKFRVLKPKG